MKFKFPDAKQLGQQCAASVWQARSEAEWFAFLFLFYLLTPVACQTFCLTLFGTFFVRIFWAVVSNFVQPESIVFYAWFSGLLSNENLHNMTSFFKWSRCFITLEHRHFLREEAFCFASSLAFSPLRARKPLGSGVVFSPLNMESFTINLYRQLQPFLHTESILIPGLYLESF